jgi:hypothetical protein
MRDFNVIASGVMAMIGRNAADRLPLENDISLLAVDLIARWTSGRGWLMMRATAGSNHPIIQ